MKKFRLMFKMASVAVLSSLLFGCQQPEPLGFLEYSSPMDHLEVLNDTFASLIAHTDSYEQKGYESYSVVYGYGFDVDEGFDRDISGNNGHYYMYASAIPAFSGLIEHAYEYEQSMGIVSNEIAREHDANFAVKAGSIEAVCRSWLKSDVNIIHGSFDGARYIETEGVYVFDNLENSFESLSDKGWELGFVYHDYDVLERLLFNRGIYRNMTVTPLWYDNLGNIYDIYGDYLFKQDNPSNRFRDLDDLIYHFVDYYKLGEDETRTATMGIISYSVGDGVDEPIEDSLPIQSITIGTYQMQLSGDR